MVKRLLIVLVLLLCLRGAAQEKNNNHLRTPDVEAYTTLIMENSEMLTPLHIRAILAEIHHRFEEALLSVSYDALRGAFAALFASPAPDGYGYLDHQEQWERSMLLAWLRENAVDLVEAGSLTFEDYDIQVTAVDFNGDGQDEYILDVVRRCAYPPCRPAAFFWGSADYQEILVVQQDQQGRIHLIATPLPWLSRHYHYSMAQSGSLKPVQISDINADGLPEWMVLSLFYAGRDFTGVRLYILGWRDGQLTDLTGRPLSYRDYTGIADYERLDVWSLAEGPPISIEQRVPIRDNWRCAREEIAEYIWNGELFELTGSEIVFPDTFECFMRRAEAAVYAYDFDTAIMLYEQALSFDERGDYADYTAMRLATAYALIDDMDRARALLAELEATSSISQLVGTLSGPVSREALCLAAYNFFVANPRYISTIFYITPGRVDDFLIFTVHPPADAPATSGCDVDWLLNKSLEEHTFPTDTPPAQQLEHLGWSVSQTFNADLNGDGIDEWLVWLDSEMLHPVLFVSEGDVFNPTRFTNRGLYRYSAEYPYPPSDHYTFTAVTLPDNSPALATLDYVIIHPYIQRSGLAIGGGALCMNTSSPQPGEPLWFPANLRLFRISEDNTLTEIFFTYICEAGEISDFIQGQNVIGWGNPVSDDWYLTEHIFTWDDAAGMFARPPTPAPTPDMPEPVLPLPRDEIISGIRNYRDSDLLSMLEIAEDLLERTTDIEPDELEAARYLRALALEALGRYDEALTEYVTLYEIAAESLWGMLAALHLENPQ